MNRVDLVFRTVGERTSDVALQMAIKNIQPNKVHVLDNVRPFWRTVHEMLRINHDCDFVVYLDADSIILEDMRPFLNWNNRAYVDCYVHDRFRGKVHCGCHITRIDLVREMAKVAPPVDDLPYVLRPESRIRSFALQELNESKYVHNFAILHDHFQSFYDIFQKYGLRELRCRTPEKLALLESAQQFWTDEPDYEVAQLALEHAREHVPLDAPPSTVNAYIERLPEYARDVMLRHAIKEKAGFSMEELDRAEARLQQPRKNFNKVFGLGLSRTGTRSLTAGLQYLGFNISHYPTDEQTFQELARGDHRFSLLEMHDGMTDITVAPYYEELDRLYPGSKFVLTVRDEETWLQSCENHWSGRDAFAPTKGSSEESHMKIRRFLRAAVYGCYDFQPERFARVYRKHVDQVLDYFRDRPEDLLVMNVVGGEGFEKLCPFLGLPIPIKPFPHKGNRLTEQLQGANPAPAG